MTDQRVWTVYVCADCTAPVEVREGEFADIGVYLTCGCSPRSDRLALVDHQIDKVLVEGRCVG